ncbi:hypothetical protein C8R44DRAFT_741181 [Mycena epipterygia]|nr:hypothetical protein C8R44DRAFT_741181 [Mycena epipterygia]
MYAKGAVRPTATSPFFILREIKPEGSEVYIGQVTLFYCADDTKRLAPVNNDGRRGALFLNDWAITQMGYTELRTECFTSNLGSVKLWKKFDFVEEWALRSTVTLSKAKGSGKEPGVMFCGR